MTNRRRTDFSAAQTWAAGALVALLCASLPLPASGHDGHDAAGSLERRAEDASLRLTFLDVLRDRGSDLVHSPETVMRPFVLTAGGVRHDLDGPIQGLLSQSLEEFQSCLASAACSHDLEAGGDSRLPALGRLKAWLGEKGLLARHGLHAGIAEASRWRQVRGTLFAGIWVTVEAAETVAFQGIHFFCFVTGALLTGASDHLSFLGQSVFGRQLDRDALGERLARVYSNFIYARRYAAAMKTVFTERPNAEFSAKQIARKLRTSPDAVERALARSPFAYVAYSARFLDLPTDFRASDPGAEAIQPLEASLAAALEPSLGPEARFLHAEDLRAFFSLQRDLLRETMFPVWRLDRRTEKDARQALVTLEIAYRRYDYLLKSIALRPDLDGPLSRRAFAALSSGLRRQLDFIGLLQDQVRSVSARTPGSDTPLLDLSRMAERVRDDFKAARFAEFPPEATGSDGPLDWAALSLPPSEEGRRPGHSCLTCDGDSVFASRRPARASAMARPLRPFSCSQFFMTRRVDP